MMIPLVVVGAGGFGREALDVALAINRVQPTYKILGVIDAGPSDANFARLAGLSIQYLGTEDEMLASRRVYRIVIGVGDPEARSRIAARYATAGVTVETLVHPSAGIGTSSVIGEGVVICAGAQVSTNVVLGDHVHLNPNSTIGHDTVLEDFVSVNPGAVVSGDVTIGRGALIGAGAVVLQGLRVGASAVVGAAACVTRDVAPAQVVKGVPAR